MLIGFLFLVSFNYEEPKFEHKHNDKKPTNSEDPVTEKQECDVTIWVRIKAVFSNLAVSIGKSFAMPFVFWSSGFVALIAVMLLFIGADREGRKLAKNQVDSYIKNYECKDGFNNDNVGCFEISGVEGDNHFVITNSEKHLIYMSRNMESKSDNKVITENQEFAVHIVEKTSDDVFKLKRIYKRTDTPPLKNNDTE